MKKTSIFMIMGVVFFVFLGGSSARAGDSDDSYNGYASPIDRPGYDADHASYQVSNSHWAVGLRAAVNSFPFSSAIGNVYQLYGDWVLPFQNFGIWSIGGHFSSFPLISKGTGNTDIPVNYGSLLGGLQARYQFRYTSYQLFVPTVAVEADYYTFRLGSNSPGDASASGMTFGFDFGIMINMGWLDRDTARDAYQTIKMSRTYLTFELHPFSVSSSDVTISGNFFYSGLRLEFE